MKITFEEMLSKIGNSSPIEMTTDKDDATSLPKDDCFFVKPSFKTLNEFLGNSSFMIIAAPGATGKSALGYHVSVIRRALLWDLSKADIGDNYFIGTLSRSFGPNNLPIVLQLINDGKMVFVIDAFDEAELSCGWNRVSSFLRELRAFSRQATGACFVLLARHETAQYLSLILDEMLGDGNYHFYGLSFFSNDQAKEFLWGYLSKVTIRFADYREKVNQIADRIFSNIDEVMGRKGAEATEASFCGYAPVLQALAVLISQYSNLQEFENEYSDTSKYNEFLETIMRNILVREKGKVLNALHIRLASKGLSTVNIESLYGEDEQLYRLACLVFNKKNNVELYSAPCLSRGAVGEYEDILKQYLPQHPFIADGMFVAPAFKDYLIARLFANETLEIEEMDDLETLYSNITPLFWQFYMANRIEKNILGIHAGIMCVSATAGKLAGDDLITSIYDTMSGTQLSTVVNIGSTDDGRFHDYAVTPDAKHGILMHFNLNNISINTDACLTIGWKSNEISITNANLNVSAIELRCKRIDVRCDELDKPVTIFSKSTIEQVEGLRIEKHGRGDFQCSWPGGKKHPWADYYVDHRETVEANNQNLLLSLKQILKWFRKDRRDSIARYSDFIDNVAINGNELNRKMLSYLLATHVLWKDGRLYKLAHKVAEKQGINFVSLKNVESNALLRDFLNKFSDHTVD